MRKMYAALVGAAALAGLLAACATETATNPTRSSPGGKPNFTITGAANTNFFNNGACTGINGNIYATQFLVGLSGSPSTLTPGPWYVLVEAPGGNPGDPSTPLGVSATAIYDGSCVELWTIVNKISDGSQGFDQTTNPGGEYRVVLSQTSDFTNGDRKSDNFKIRVFVPPCVPGVDPLCTPQPPLSLFSVIKFYDTNLDGVKQATEPFISGWEFNLTLAGLTTIQVTPYNEQVLSGLAYSASELHPIQTNWIQTAPTGNSFTGTTSSSDLTLQFGNVCTGAGGGLTLGFWSNKNGQAFINGTDLSLLTSLNLRDAAGANFDPTTYTQFRTWILNATATNMAYMLSAQLAAMELNTTNGSPAFVNSNALIYVGTSWNGTAISFSGLNALGFATVADVMAAANTSLGTDGLTLGAGDTRNYQEALKNALDAANNNLNFLQIPVGTTIPCAFSFAVPPTA